MTIDPDELIKVIANQSYQIRLMALQLADQASLIEPHVPRCMTCQKKPACVEHTALKARLCDRCAAEMIVKASRAYVSVCKHDPNDPYAEIFSTMMDENAWRDLDDAEKIRRMTDFVNAIKETDVTQERTH